MTGTDVTSDSAIPWAPCHCCGRSYPVTRLVAFHHHPGDHLCFTCLNWLWGQARPITRLLNSRMPLRPSIRAWSARLIPRALARGKVSRGCE